MLRFSPGPFRCTIVLSRNALYSVLPAVGRRPPILSQHYRLPQRPPSRAYSRPPQLHRHPASMKSALDTLLHIYGVPILKDSKIIAPKKAALCLVHIDRLLPMGLAVLMKKDLEAKFKKPDGVISDAKSSVLIYGMEQAKAITDELIKAHALASMSTEDSRTGLYKRLSKMEYTIFYTNKSEDLDDTVLKDIVDYGIAGAGVTTHEIVMQKTRMNYWNQYWSVFPGTGNKELLMFRDPKATTAIQSMYDLYMNRLYVSLGAFIAPMHKNSRHNMMLSARYAYYIIKGILNTFTLHGSMVGPYEEHSDPWMGYIFSSRLEAYGTCVASERKSNGTLNAVHDPVDAAAVIPAFRYYRKLLLERAYPRPEYRIDLMPRYNLIQLFFYVWAQPLCGRPSKKGLINSVTRNTYYFNAGFECAGKKATPCDIWNTTRRAY
uniref:Uncharacterized protein n=1 Tax=Ixodes ricinus TaxID=34613 RepID=A0A6B0VAA8_IXORI